MRMLTQLKSGWADTTQREAIARRDWSALPAFDQLSHPALQSCVDYDDNPVGPRYTRHEGATSAAGYTVVEARDKGKGPGWRTAIIEKSGLNWAVYAAPHDEFHRSVAAKFSSRTRADVEPTEEDAALRKLKAAEATFKIELDEWRRELVEISLTVFKQCWDESGALQGIALPEPPTSLLPPGLSSLEATIEIEFAMSDSLSEPAITELVLRLGPRVQLDEPLTLTIIQTVLPVFAVDEDRWTRTAFYNRSAGLTLSTELDVDEIARVLFAAEVDAAGLALTELGPTGYAHYAPKSEIVRSVVDGAPARAACGTWLVSRRIPESCPPCPKCEEHLPDASVVREMLKAQAAS